MRRRPRLPAYVVDSALAVALTAPTIAGLVLDESQPDHPWWLVAPIAAATTLPLAARRSYPLAVLGVVLVGTLALNAIGISTLGPGILIATYTVGAHLDRYDAIRAGAAALVAMGAAAIWRDGLGTSVADELAIVAGAWLLGQYLRTRRAYLRELEEKAERLEREREENERRAAAEEQARIARELHDVIAHNVSVMVVQATGGREVFDTNPARAREALEAIESTGREALSELRRLLGVARSGDASREPQPGVVQLPSLVEQVRDAGLEVELEVEGDPRPLPSGVDLSAFRVVQEALTNTLKHAGARRAQVVVRYRERELVVDVLDDGIGGADAGPRDGHGLVGMRERVALFGGELATGTRDDGGFRVSARFPTRSEP